MLRIRVGRSVPAGGSLLNSPGPSDAARLLLGRQSSPALFAPFRAAFAIILRTGFPGIQIRPPPAGWACRSLVQGALGRAFDARTPAAWRSAWPASVLAPFAPSGGRHRSHRIAPIWENALMRHILNRRSSRGCGC